jgi:hypothetical protein
LSKNIGDDSVFYNVFMKGLLNSDDQIVLDKEERLATTYIKLIEHDDQAMRNYCTWQKMLEVQSAGKVIKSSSTGATSSVHAVYSTISKAVTTSCKTILTDDNDSYADFIDELNRQRIYMLNIHSLTALSFNEKKRKPIYQELEADLEWVLHRLGRRAEKTDSEDYNNDYLRDMLLSKRYEIKDQGREGKSSSGKGAGELDLVIEDHGSLFAILEALKLSSVDTININLHYFKLLSNYNPLRVKRTFLVTYYCGASFDVWWRKYVGHIESLDFSVFIGPDYDSISEVVESTTEFPTIKKLHHHFSALGEPSICTHFAIRL